MDRRVRPPRDVDEDRGRMAAWQDGFLVGMLAGSVPFWIGSMVVMLLR